MKIRDGAVAVKGIQTRKGAVLMWRLGDLKFGPQRRWDRAPESKGMWAFPWPYFETFFAYHKYTDALPKHLQRDDRYYPRDLRWYGRVVGEKIEGEELGFSWPTPILEPFTAEEIANPPSDMWIESDDPEDTDPVFNIDKYGVLDELEEAQDAWVKNIGRKIVPMRKFWYEGDIYAHFTRRGEVLPVSEWQVLHTSELAAAVKKNRGDRYFSDRDPSSYGGAKPFSAQGRYSHDHFEVFFSRGMGKISG